MQPKTILSILLCLLTTPGICDTTEKKQFTFSEINIDNSSHQDAISIEFKTDETQSMTLINAFLKPDTIIYTQITLPNMDIAEDIVVDNGYAYVASGYQGIHVVSVKNIERPQPVAHLTEYVNYIRRLCIYKSYLIATNYKKGILVYRLLGKGGLRLKKQLCHTNFDHIIVDIAVINEYLVARTSTNQFYKIKFPECTQKNASLPVVEDLTIEDQFYDAKKISQQTPSDDTELLIEYNLETSERKLILSGNIEQDKAQRLLEYPLYDVRNYFVANDKNKKNEIDDKIYVANGFDGIAILASVIDSSVVSVENGEINLSFPKENIYSLDYSLIFYEKNAAYTIDDLIIKLENTHSKNRPGNLILEIVAPEKPDEVVVIDLTDIKGEEIFCYALTDEKNEFYCYALPDDKTYQVIIKKKNIVHLGGTFQVLAYKDIRVKVNATPPEDFSPQTKVTLTLYPGWNDFSFPVMPDKKSMNGLLTANITEYITQNTLHYYNYESQAFEFHNNQADILPGMGYWLKQPYDITPTTISLTGEDITGYSISCFVSENQPTKGRWLFIGCINENNAELLVSDRSFVRSFLTYEVDDHSTKNYDTIEVKDYLLNKKQTYWIKLLKTSSIWMSKQ